MATEEDGGRTVAYASDQVDQLLRCSVCLERYNQPRILPCQHTFCVSPCLQGLVDMMARSVRCPECRMEHYVPAQGAHGFPTNRIVANFLELQAQTIELPTPRAPEPEEEPSSPEEEQQETEVPGKCGVCEKDAETSRCVHCSKLACEACRKTHFNQMKFDVGRLVNQIRRGIPKISNAISGVEQKSEQVKQHVEGIKSEVRDTIERYIKEMRDREKMLCSELDTFLQGEQRNLRLHQENLEVDIASISSYCESTESRVNRAECDLTEEDLVNMKHQCSEYMTQLGSVESDAIPETRTAGFSFSGTALHASIVGFGEVAVGDSTARRRNSVADISVSPPSPVPEITPPRSTAPVVARRASVPAQNGPSHPVTSGRPPPAGPSRLNDQISRGLAPTYTSAPFATSAAEPYTRTRSPLFRSASDVSGANDFGPYSGYMTSPRTLDALRSGYMFQMDNDMYSFLPGMDLSEPAPTGNTRNTSSIFGRDTHHEDRPAGFMGGGGGGGGGAPAATVAPRVIDNRPAVSFSVGMGANGASRARARPPRRLRTRGTTERGRGGSSSTSNQSSNQTETETPTRGAAPTRTNTKGRSRGAKRGAAAHSGGETYRANEASQGGSNNNEGASSSEPQAGPSGEQHPRLQARRGTYVMDEEEDEDLSRPSVDSEHDDDDDVIMGASNNNSTNANLVHNETQVNTRAANNYQRKGVMKKKLGGERGNATGQFSWPRGVTISPSNDSIVVADSSNHRVQIFDCNGVYVTTFGSYGSGPGEFDCLAGVAVNSNGQIIIADRYNHRVQIFDRYGTFLKQFGREGNGQGQLSYPWGVAVDYLGNIFVCDKENHRLQVFKPDGSFLRKIGRLGSRNGQMENPHYVTVGHDGRVIVSDTSNHRIQVFNSDGRHILNIGSEGSENGQLKLPKGVAVDQQGFIIVADSGNSRIQVFRPNGSYYSGFGEHGTGPGQFKGLEGLTLTSDGKVIVSDKENHRVQIF